MKNYSSIWIHCIWTTKDRQPLLDRRFRIRLFEYIKKNALENGYVVDVINGIEDHVHCLIRLMPRQKLSAFAKTDEGKFIQIYK